MKLIGNIVRNISGWLEQEDFFVKIHAPVILMLFCCLIFVGAGYAQEESGQPEDVSEGQVVKESPQNTEAGRDDPQAEAQKPAVPKPSVTQEDSQKQEFLERIEELEKRINELTEESRARRKLEITEQEKQEKEKDVLEAVGREYTLDAKHSVGLDYTLQYGYSPSERFDSQLLVTEEADHTIKHIVSVSYGILDNLSASTTIPFVYRYHEVGTDQEIDETDIGDISAGVSWQPWRSKTGEVTKTLNFSVSMPSGRSPYKINPGTELSTGNGVFSFSAGGSFSKQIDPVVAFWSLSYTYNLDATNLNQTFADQYVLEKVKTGNEISASAGLAYALSYKVSVNSSISYVYTFNNEYYYRYATTVLDSGDNVSATLGLGMGWKLNNKTTLSFSLGYALTGSGFSASVRVPFNFVL